MTATTEPGTGVATPGRQQPAGYMDAEAMLTYVSERLDSKLVDSEIAYGQLTAIIDPEGWVDAARLCKEDPGLACRFWEFLDAIDRGEDGFDVVVHIYSHEHHHDITMRTRVPGGRSKPVLASLTDVFRGANWSERETYDMFGIEFEGHPGLEPRILTIENFEGWPLRKDFQLTSRNVKPWPGAKEPGESKAEAGEGDAAAPAGATAEPEDRAEAAKAKAERAKAKAAEMRAKKAAERAEEQSAAAGGATTAAPSGDVIADAAEELGGGDTEGEAAAAAATAAGDETAATPEGAAEVADSAIAKDAAAGAADGDVAEGATQDEANVDEPVVDDAAEAEAAEGAPPSAGATPGIEAEGTADDPEAPSVTDEDTPVVPAQGSAAAPLDSDPAPEDAEDERHGLERETLGVSDEDAGTDGPQTAQAAEGGSGPEIERTEEGPSPAPSASEQTDAADRADDNREMGSDQAVEDDGGDR